MLASDKYAWLKSSNQNSELDCLIYSDSLDGFIDRQIPRIEELIAKELYQDSSPCEQLVEVNVGKTDLLFKLLIQKMTAIHAKLEQ